jgi:hypothetical protein
LVHTRFRGILMGRLFLGISFVTMPMPTLPPNLIDQLLGLVSLAVLRALPRADRRNGRDGANGHVLGL